MVQETIEDGYFDLVVDIPVLKYYVRFSFSTGAITEVFPSRTDISDKNCLEIDADLADKLLRGIKSLTSIKIDITEFPFKILEDQSHNLVLSKIDNVLHRIIEKKWSTISKPDIHIVYDRSNEELTFKINPSIKEMTWPGEKEMIFLVTGYNDPNDLKEMIKFSIDELTAYPQKFKCKLRTKFSIFTRRLFSNYTLEIR